MVQAQLVHDNGPFKTFAWFKEDQEKETRDFICAIEEQSEDYVFGLTGNDKLTKEDAAEADKKFVDPFVCPICFNIIQEKNVQCKDCQQVYDEVCIAKWLEQNHSCPSCNRDRFNSTIINRNLRNQLDIVDFSCKSCSQVVPYSQRRVHSRTCPNLVIEGCPFDCNKVVTGTFAQLKEHLRRECQAGQLNCPACDYTIYRVYSDTSLIGVKKGHNCLRDFGSSPILLQNLMTMQNRLRLLDAEIPNECKPCQNDPFWVKRSENTNQEFQEFCKYNIIAAIKAKGFTNDATNNLIHILQESYGSHWRVVIAPQQRLDTVAQLSQVTPSGKYIRFEFTKGGIVFEVVIQQVK